MGLTMSANIDSIVEVRQAIKQVWTKPDRGETLSAKPTLKAIGLPTEDSQTDYRILQGRDLEDLASALLFKSGLPQSKTNWFNFGPDDPVVVTPLYEADDDIGGLIVVRCRKHGIGSKAITWTLATRSPELFGGATVGKLDDSDEHVIVSDYFHKALQVRAMHRSVMGTSLPIYYWYGNPNLAKSYLSKSDKVIWTDKLTAKAFKLAIATDGKIIINRIRLDNRTTYVADWMRDRILSKARHWKDQLKIVSRELPASLFYRLLCKIDEHEAWELIGAQKPAVEEFVTCGRMRIARDTEGWKDLVTGENVCGMTVRVLEVAQVQQIKLLVTCGRVRYEDWIDYTERSVSDLANGLSYKMTQLTGRPILVHPDFAPYLLYVAMKDAKLQVTKAESSLEISDSPLPSAQD